MNHYKIIDQLWHCIFVIGIRGGFHFLDDINYLKLMYYAQFRKKLDLKNPKSFNEKLQWLKIYKQQDLYTTLVDKYAVKQYIKDKIGINYIIPTYGVWNSYEEINFENLPQQFVLKCTHDSGGLCICRNKKEFNLKKAKRKINKSLRKNFFWSGRETPYKKVPPRIIAEMYMEDQSTSSLIDYKFYCFNGEPYFLYISSGLENHKTARISFLNLNWEPEKFVRIDYKPFEKLPDKPIKFNEMVIIARKLSQGIPFVRVDLYSINNNIYFSEMTFSPCSGFMKFVPEEADLQIGKLLKIDC